MDRIHRQTFHKNHIHNKGSKYHKAVKNLQIKRMITVFTSETEHTILLLMALSNNVQSAFLLTSLKCLIIYLN